MTEPTTTETPTPAKVDPAHDIDGKATAVWLVVSTVVVFLSLWLLLNLFSFVVQQQRHEKVELAPTPVLDALRAYEHKALSAGPAEQMTDPEATLPKRMSIEDAMRAYVNK